MFKSFELLNQELINKGLVYSNDDSQYEESQHLVSIHSWGYILAFNCIVLDTSYELYDSEHQLICVLDDECTWTTHNGILKCTRKPCFGGKEHSFTYNLNAGAPIHKSDVETILYKPGATFPDIRVIFLKSGKIYYKEDGKVICESNRSIREYLADGLAIIPEESWPNNIDIFNDLLVGWNYHEFKAYYVDDAGKEITLFTGTEEECLQYRQQHVYYSKFYAMKDNHPLDAHHVVPSPARYLIYVKEVI